MGSSIEQVRLTVNGKEITLNPFVTSIIGNTVLGMISALKLDDVATDIQVNLKLHRNRKIQAS